MLLGSFESDGVPHAEAGVPNDDGWPNELIVIVEPKLLAGGAVAGVPLAKADFVV